jgi:hypothetical protein
VRISARACCKECKQLPTVGLVHRLHFPPSPGARIARMRPTSSCISAAMSAGWLKSREALSIPPHDAQSIQAIKVAGRPASMPATVRRDSPLLLPSGVTGHAAPLPSLFSKAVAYDWPSGSSAQLGKRAVAVSVASAAALVSNA